MLYVRTICSHLELLSAIGILHTFSRRKGLTKGRQAPLRSFDPALGRGLSQPLGVLRGCGGTRTVLFMLDERNRNGSRRFLHLLLRGIIEVVFRLGLRLRPIHEEERALSSSSSSLCEGCVTNERGPERSCSCTTLNWAPPPPPPQPCSSRLAMFALNE